MASLMVGWANTVAIRSSSVASSVMAMAKPWIISVTSWPIMWAPSRAPVLPSNTVLTKPSISPAATALPFTRNGKRPTFGS